MTIARFFRPRSLKYQLLSRTILILALLLILIGLVQYVWMNNFLYGNKAASIESQIDSIPNGIWKALGSGGTVPDRNTLFEIETPRSTIAFITPTGKFFDLYEDDHGDGDDGQAQRPNSNANDVRAPELPKATYQNALATQTDMTYTTLKDQTGNNLLVVLHRIGDRTHPTGVVQVTTPTDPLKDILTKQLSIFGFLVVCALIAGLFGFVPILRRTLVPLSRMVQTVRRINAGNLDERLSTVHAQAEIELLASSFNGMLERLETAFETERSAKERMSQFIADASHELRTPLTTIHAFLEVLLRGAMQEPVKLERALRSMYIESDRMKKLIEDLLFLARQDRPPTFQFKDVSVDILILGMESQLRLLARGRTVTLSIEEGITVNCELDRMKQVILNLFQNAVQHTDEKTGAITLTLTTDFAGVRISVKDNGPGISDVHKSQLFERFYRVDSARSRKDGGVGLGLSIAKSIVEQHGGEISFDSTLGEGTVFNVWIPMQ